MKFSKEFRQWWQEYSKENGFPNKVEGFYTFDLQTTYDAFKAHDEELKRLRQFEKKFRTLQNKIAEYEGKSADCYFSNPDKSVNYEAKAEELKDELLYL